MIVADVDLLREANDVIVMLTREVIALRSQRGRSPSVLALSEDDPAAAALESQAALLAHIGKLEAAMATLQAHATAQQERLAAEHDRREEGDLLRSTVADLRLKVAGLQDEVAAAAAAAAQAGLAARHDGQIAQVRAIAKDSIEALSASLQRTVAQNQCLAAEVAALRRENKALKASASKAPPSSF